MPRREDPLSGDCPLQYVLDMVRIRQIIGPISVALLLVAAPSAAAPLPKTGEVCPRKGITKIVGTARLSCVVQGKRLVWKKVSPPKRPVTSPAANPDPTQVSEQAYVGMDAVNVEIFKKLDAYALELLSRTSSADTQVTIEVENPSDPFNQTVSDVAKLGFKLLRTIQPQLPAQNVFLYENVSWVEPRVMPICPKTMEWVRQYGQANAGCGVLFVADMIPFHKFGIDQAKTIPTHEMFHNVTIKAESEIPESQRRYEQVASWFTEGMAQITSGLTRALYADSKRPLYGNLVWQDNWRQRDCATAFELWQNGRINANHAETNHCEYGLGRLMSEILVARSGSLDPVIEMHKDRAQGIPFFTSMEHRFGISNDEFMKLVKQRLITLGWDLS